MSPQIREAGVRPSPPPQSPPAAPRIIFSPVVAQMATLARVEPQPVAGSMVTTHLNNNKKRKEKQKQRKKKEVVLRASKRVGQMSWR